MRRAVKIIAGIEPFFGTLDENLQLFESAFMVSTHLGEDSLEIEGKTEPVEHAVAFLEDYAALAEEGHEFDDGRLRSLIKLAARDGSVSLRELTEAPQPKLSGKKTVTPKSPNQRAYMEAMASHDMVFSIGPGGTGKTYLAVTEAVSALLSKRFNRIILARPAVEAGERLGFLPGTLQEKVDPYMRPLYDALHDLLDADKLARLLEKGVIEIAPLAFMRGRTLNDSFVILDEAQNTTSEQMKMFLTRLGFNSKAVITGDVTQIDLPAHRRSGLVEALEVVGEIPGIEVVRLDESDVVRHNLVQQIIRAYESYETENESQTIPMRNASGD